MNLSIFASYVMNRTFPTPEIGLKHMYDQGVRYVDISEGLLPMYPFHLQIEYFRDAGLIPECMITTQDVVTAKGLEKKKNIAIVKGYIDQLEKLKIPYIMVAPKVVHARSRQAVDDMREMMIESFSELTEYAKGSGVTVTIENQSSVTRADSSMADVRTLLDAVPYLGYVLDSGNFYCIREDVLKAYDLLRDRMVHAHFKDWKENPFGAIAGEHLPRVSGAAFGEGLLPLVELKKRMQRDGYSGSVALEFNDCEITPEVLDNSARFMRT